ncbi:phage tail spike protein [Paraclostridium sp. AKS73]|uniref:phage tail spike protein n=1 Tax=Paraclostridium sp. AKS73 TaxID=2876116 RepID=UPI0021DFEEFB|nr:phage tail spike protein [Paraclostridium sp. AKS73]MCU9815828.1 phage tail protein [Paraclostridium sp. AKS73]
MIPILYDKTGKIKLGELVDIIDSGYVEEERNGIFEFTIDYPVGYPLSDLLVEENMIEAKPNEEQGLQKFRIYDTKRLMKNVILVFARHESFDLANDHVENVNLENASCEYALNTLFRNSHFSTHYRGYSDIINAQNYKIDNINILNAIAGKEGSIIDTYGTGAEILRDGTNIHVLNKRGHDNEVTIEFGKNLTDFVLERDLTDLETRVGGFAKYTPEGGKETIVKSNWIDSPYIDNFAHPYINIEGRRDYSDKFKDGEVPTVDKLNKLCEDEFKINKRDIPKSNYTIKFIPLSKCVGYEGIQDKISLCDTVRIIDKRFNVDTKAKVIKYKYDFVKERYESMELGEPRTTLGDVIGGSSGEKGPPGKDGQNGKDGEQGPPGQDGNVENMPDTLPNTPVLTPKVYGMGSVELSWTFENKLYYTYELYASRTKDFTPNFQDLIHAGQSSSFLFKANPDETWYFKVCAMNSHNRRTGFSNQVEVALPKIEDMNNYFSEIAIGHAVAQSITADYMEAGMFKGHWIDTKNLSCTDGNGKRTFDIDSFGRLTMMPTSFKLLVDGREEGVVTQSAFNSTLDGFEYRFFNNTEPNMLRNTSFLNGWKYWNWNGSFEKFIYHDGNFGNGDTARLEFTDENQGLFQRDMDCTHGLAIRVIANASRPVNVMVGIEGVKTEVFTIGNGDGWSTLEVIVPPIPRFGTFIFYTQAGGPHTVYVNQFKVQTGNICTPWSPHREEIYSNTTTIDGEGIEIKHDNGSMSKFTHEAIDFLNSQGLRTLRVKDGGLNFYTYWDPAEMVAFIKSSSLGSTSWNGATLSTYGNGDYISIGTSSSVDENAWKSDTAIIIVPHANIQEYPEIGTWFVRSAFFKQIAKFKSGIKMDYGNVEFNSSSEFPHLIYNSTANNFCVMGDNSLKLGIREGTINRNIIDIEEDGSQINKGYVHNWASWNFHGHKLENVNMTYALQPQTSFLRTMSFRFKEINESYAITSMTNGDIRLACRDNQIISSDNKKLIVELPQIFAENIESNYHLNISKMSWGDYRIIEKNTYYFEIETNVDNFSFTYEVVAKLIEKPDAYTSIAKSQYMVQESNEINIENDEIKSIIEI